MVSGYFNSADLQSSGKPGISKRQKKKPYANSAIHILLNERYREWNRRTILNQTLR
jgi:hypothetical protein